MTAKEYLQQAQKIDRRIKLDKGKLEAMRSALYGKAVSYENDGSKHIGGSNGVENAYIRLLEWEERVNGEIAELIQKRLEIEKAIASVPDDVQREILERRYLLYQKWEVIAVEMGYSLRRVTQLHGTALKNISLNFPL